MTEGRVARCLVWRTVVVVACLASVAHGLSVTMPHRRSWEARVRRATRARASGFWTAAPRGLTAVYVDPVIAERVKLQAPALLAHHSLVQRSGFPYNNLANAARDSDARSILELNRAASRGRHSWNDVAATASPRANGAWTLSGGVWVQTAADDSAPRGVEHYALPRRHCPGVVGAPVARDAMSYVDVVKGDGIAPYRFGG